MGKRTICIALVATLTSCAADGPPTLPGAEDPPCRAASPHHYVISSLDPDDPDAIDLSVPPDGRPDNLAYPYTYIEGGVGSTLKDALARALASQHLAWVITVQTCEDDPSYVRVALRQATGVAATSPLETATLAPDATIWAVGKVTDAAIEVSQGIGVVPVAAPLDVQADASETAWFPFYNFAMHAQPGTGLLSGSLAGAVETSVAAPAVADAIARTLTAAHAAEPACPPTCANSALADLFHVFDPNGDFMFSASEVLASGGLVPLGYFPDLDLLVHEHDRTVFWPAHDHDAESLGNGYVFQAHEIAVQ